MAKEKTTAVAEEENWWDGAGDVLTSLAGAFGSAYSAREQARAAQAQAEKERLAAATEQQTRDEKTQRMLRIALIVGGGVAVVGIVILALK